MNDKTIEQKIQAKGLTAPRITPADIEANITSEHFFTGWDGINGAFSAGTLHQRSADMDTSNGQKMPVGTPYEATSKLTFCVLLLRNGTKIVGINYGAIDPTQHSAAQGRFEARANAIEQIWPLMGYELRSKLAEK